MEKAQSFQKTVEKTEYPHAKQWNWTLTLYHIQELAQNVSITDLNLRDKTIKFLEENIGQNFNNTGSGNDFFGLTPKAQVTKNRQTGLHDN